MNQPYSNSSIKKQINIVQLIFSLSGTHTCAYTKRSVKGKSKLSMWKNDLRQNGEKCLPFFNSDCVGVFPSSSSSGTCLNIQYEKVNFLCDINENTTILYLKNVENKDIEWNGFSYEKTECPKNDLYLKRNKPRNQIQTFLT